jgi:hypothetical protein
MPGNCPASSSVQQSVDQYRGAPANVDDRLSRPGTRRLDQLQRERRLVLEPAHVGHRRTAVHAVPVSETSHPTSVAPAGAGPVRRVGRSTQTGLPRPHDDELITERQGGRGWPASPDPAATTRRRAGREACGTAGRRDGGAHARRSPEVPVRRTGCRSIPGYHIRDQGPGTDGDGVSAEMSASAARLQRRRPDHRTGAIQDQRQPPNRPEKPLAERLLDATSTSGTRVAGIEPVWGATAPAAYAALFRSVDMDQ